jgi:hypothetical protein
MYGTFVFTLTISSIEKVRGLQHTAREALPSDLPNKSGQLTWFFNQNTIRWLNFKLHVTWKCESSLNSHQKAFRRFLRVPEFWQIRHIQIPYFIVTYLKIILIRGTVSPRNGHVYVPVYSLKRKQGYAVRKMKKDNVYGTYWYVLVWNSGTQEVPVLYTGMCRPISGTGYN